MAENFAFFEEEEVLLDGTMKELRCREEYELINDSKQRETHLQFLLSEMTPPWNGLYSFQNLLCHKSKDAYIGQCLVDLGYSIRWQQHSRKYFFQAVAFAKLENDLGQINLRPETWGDKILGRFINRDIDLTTTTPFNEKYLLESTDPELVKYYFDTRFVEAIADSDDLLLRISGDRMFLLFESKLKSGQLLKLENIFACCSFLRKTK